MVENDFQGLPWWSSVENLLSNPGGAGLIPGQGTKIPYVVWRGQKNTTYLDY